MREIALDTETTGLSHEDGDRITEIGCVEMINHVPTGNEFHVYLNPEREVPPEVTEITGLTTEFLRDKPLFHQIADDFLDFVKDCPLVIHNAKFDMKFLNFELERCGRPPLPSSQSIDTLIMARKMFPGQPANLDALSRRFNIHIPREKHGALLDAQILAAVYLELCGGRQRSFDLSSPEDTDKEAKSIDIKPKPVSFPYRAFPPSSLELEAFKQVLSKIKDPLWLEDEKDE